MRRFVREHDMQGDMIHPVIDRSGEFVSDSSGRKEDNARMDFQLLLAGSHESGDILVEDGGGFRSTAHARIGDNLEVFGMTDEEVGESIARRCFEQLGFYPFQVGKFAGD